MADSRNRPSLKGAPFTTAFIAICALIFIVGFFSPTLRMQIFLRFGQLNAAVARGEWWLIFTSAVLHANLVHVAFNMWALAVFGPPLERQVGSAAFGATCLASAAWGGAAAYLLTGPRGAVVGASGAIFGVFGMWLVASYLSRETPMGQAQFRSLMTLLVINAVLSFGIPSVSWQGHAGGLAAGLAIAAVWRQLPAPATGAQRAAVAIGAAAIAVVTVLLVPNAGG